MGVALQERYPSGCSFLFGVQGEVTLAVHWACVERFWWWWATKEAARNFLYGGDASWHQDRPATGCVCEN